MDRIRIKVDAAERRPRNKLWKQNRKAKTILLAQEKVLEICGRGL